MIKIKMHMMPGDICKHEKISMLEGRHRDKRRSKSLRKLIYSRLRAVLKERTDKEIEDALV